MALFNHYSYQAFVIWAIVAWAVTFSGKWARLAWANGCNSMIKVSILREIAHSYIVLISSAQSMAVRRVLHPLALFFFILPFFFCHYLSLSFLQCCYTNPPVSLLLIKWTPSWEMVSRQCPDEVVMYSIFKLNWPLSPFHHLQTRTESTSQSQVNLHDNLHATGNRVPTETWQWGRHDDCLPCHSC